MKGDFNKSPFPFLKVLMKYNRVLIKLSGEALAGDQGFGISGEVLNKISSEIVKLHATGCEIAIVVGGGNIHRGVAGATTGMDRATSDYMGMMATVINCLALQDSLERNNVYTRVMSAIDMQEVAEPYIRRRAVRHLEKKRVVIFAGGTGNPYFTTDTAAALRASEMGCDLLLKATKVQGVYTKDPVHHKDAVFLPRLTYDQVLDQNLRVMDTAAIALTRENSVPIAVFSIYENDGFAKVINGQGRFTLIQ
jgi:uridylate kinase